MACSPQKIKMGGAEGLHIPIFLVIEDDLGIGEVIERLRMIEMSMGDNDPAHTGGLNAALRELWADFLIRRDIEAILRLPVGALQKWEVAGHR